MNSCPMQSVPWQIGSWNIPFFVGHDCAREIAERLAALDADRLLLVADETALKLHSGRYEAALGRLTHLRVIPWSGGEVGKSLSAVEALCSRLIREGATRRSIVIACGGGSLGNIAGLAAALLFRGVRLVHLPTTLLAMHDSVTSLKQGVNCDGVKNIVGAYHPPAAILVDTEFLSTLPGAQVRGGLAELVKDALILGGDFAEELGQAIAAQKSPESWLKLIRLGVAAKSALMGDDPHERGAALALEYGHTFGHAIELACGGALNHGDSIAWGMHCAAWVASEMGVMSEASAAGHDRWLGLLGDLPRPHSSVSMAQIRRRIGQDNKRGYLPAGDSVAMVLLGGVGEASRDASGIPLTLVPDSIIDQVLARLWREWKI